MTLIQMSISGSWIILATIIVRAVAKRKLPPRMLMVFWGIAFLRLMLPVSIPSPVSQYAFWGRMPEINHIAADILPHGKTAIHGIGQTASTIAADPRISIWTLVWMIGTALSMLLFVISYVRWHRIFRTSVPVEHMYAEEWLHEHRLWRRIRIRQSDQIMAPLTYGVLRPIILMPKNTDWEDIETLGFVMAHEYMHIRRFDACVKPLLALMLCVHWYNPLVWAMYALANRDIEICCDRMVVHSAVGAHARKRYALALLNMEEARSGLIGWTNSFSGSAIEERMNAIMSMKKFSITAIVASCLLIVGVTAAFATSAAVSVSESKNSDRLLSDSQMTELAIERLSQRYPDVAEWVRSQYADTVYWTYEGYQAWSDANITWMRDLLGKTTDANSTGEMIVTQAMIDEQIASDAEILRQLADGLMISKSMGGDENLGGSFCPEDIHNSSTRELQYSILLKNGEEATFGPYATAAEMLEILEPFCQRQVATGNLDPAEADEIIQELKSDEGRR